MAIEKFTEDVEVIRKLGTFPNEEDGLSGEQLQSKFDEAPRKIKEYMNNTLIPAIEQELGQKDAFVVTLSPNGATDKSFAQIQEAYGKGMSCYCNRDGFLMPLVMMESSAHFAGVWHGREYRVEIAADDVTVEVTELGGGGLTTEQINALDGMFRMAAYTADASDAYAAFRKAFGLDSGEGDHAHSYASSVTKEATCETDGIQKHTCFCGHSYTTAIPATGHDYADGVCTKCGASDPNHSEPEVPDVISVRYELPEATTFDGSNYIDTGVMLLDEGRDWTICLDYTPTAKEGRPFDISGNRTGGVYMGLRGGYGWNVYCAGTLTEISTKIENMKVVITHVKGADSMNVTWVTDSATLSTYSFVYDENNFNIKMAKNIILGADYTKEQDFAKGTLHRFMVYNGVLGEAAIHDFLGVSE